MPTPAGRVPPAGPAAEPGRVTWRRSAQALREPDAHRVATLELRAGPDPASTPARPLSSALLAPLPPAPPRLLRRSFVVSHAERGWERAGRPAVAGGRRCAQRGRGAAAASASRAGRAPDGRRRRRGLRAGDRVGPGGGSPRAAPANRVAGFRARSLARRHAHTRGRSGEGAEPAERQIPARCESPGQVGARAVGCGKLGQRCSWALCDRDIVFLFLEIGVVAVFCPGFPVSSTPGSS